MTIEEQTLLIVKGVISELPAVQQEACNELAHHICVQIERAGSPVGPLAMALVGAKMQVEATKE